MGRRNHQGSLTGCFQGLQDAQAQVSMQDRGDRSQGLQGGVMKARSRGTYQAAAQNFKRDRLDPHNDVVLITKNEKVRRRRAAILKAIKEKKS